MLRRSVACLLSVSFAMSTAGCKRAPEVEIDHNLSIGSTHDLNIARDVAYAPGPRRSLDVYAPKAGDGAAPVIVYIYGGAWASGSKEESAWIGASLARRGFVAVIPDYRIYPEGLWPLFLQDNAAAVAWTRRTIAHYGGDPNQIVLVGHSSGAFNVFSLAVDRRWLEAEGLDPKNDVRAVIGLSGPYSMLPLDGRREHAIFGKGRNYTEPYAHIDGRSPPLLLLVGAEDGAAGPWNSPEAAENVRKKGGEAEAILYPSVSHADTRDAFGGLPLGSNAPILKDISAFLARHGVSPRAQAQAGAASTLEQGRP